MRWALGLVAALTLAAMAAPAASAAVVVDVAPRSQDATLGDAFEVRATVSNEGTSRSEPLTAHLEIIDPTRAGSVDAEDWVPDLNARLGAIPPGASRDTSWTLTPIAGGRYAVYVVALAEGAASSRDQAAVASTAIPVDVTEVRTLNPGGALPVAIVVPLLLLAALVGLRGRLRRTAPPGTA